MSVEKYPPGKHNWISVSVIWYCDCCGIGAIWSTKKWFWLNIELNIQCETQFSYFPESCEAYKMMSALE